MNRLSVAWCLSVLCLGGCSLLVRSKLEDNEAKPDSRNADAGLRDGQLTRDHALGDNSHRESGPILDGQIPGPELIITGENPKGNPGPFVIGEMIHIKVKNAGATIKNAFIGLDPPNSTPTQPDPTLSVPIPCLGSWDASNQTYNCTISPMTLNGRQKIYLTDDSQPTKVIAQGEIEVRRLLILGGSNILEGYLVDAETLTLTGTIQLPGKIASESHPLLSPSGRYLLLTCLVNVNGVATERMMLVDLVLRERAEVPGQTSTNLASFEPSYSIFQTKLAGPVAVYRPEEFLWVIDGTDAINRVTLPAMGKFPSINVNKLQSNRVLQEPAPLWVPALDGDKWMVVMNSSDVNPNLTQPCIYRPKGATFSFSCDPLKDPPPPEAEIQQISYAQGRDLSGTGKPGSELALVVLSTVFFSSSSGLPIDSYLTTYRMDANGLARTSEMFPLGSGNTFLGPLVPIPTTDLVGLQFGTSPDNSYRYASVSYASAPAGRPDFKPTVITTLQRPVIGGAMTQGLATTPWKRRMLVRSDNEVSGLGLEGGDENFLATQTYPSLLQVQHHPRREQYYVLTEDKLLKRYAYGAEGNNATPLERASLDLKTLPQAPDGGGFFIQP